jgi:8-oxo-dGTP pyrophosphatase MutT (NUDIX family)
VCLIRQFRHAAGGWVWELPAGKLEPREPPLETAHRELREEAGTNAQNWQSLGTYVSSPGVFTEIVHLYLARELDSVKMAHEAAELIEVHWVELEDACTRALHGDINDGKTALGLLRARSVLESSQARGFLGLPWRPHRRHNEQARSPAGGHAPGGCRPQSFAGRHAGAKDARRAGEVAHRRGRLQPV